jgi:hypothetical protein
MRKIFANFSNMGTASNHNAWLRDENQAFAKR